MWWFLSAFAKDVPSLCEPGEGLVYGCATEVGDVMWFCRPPAGGLRVYLGNSGGLLDEERPSGAAPSVRVWVFPERDPGRRDPWPTEAFELAHDAEHGTDTLTFEVPEHEAPPIREATRHTVTLSAGGTLLQQYARHAGSNEAQCATVGGTREALLAAFAPGSMCW